MQTPLISLTASTTTAATNLKKANEKKKPNRFSQNSLLISLCKSGEVKEALAFLESPSIRSSSSTSEEQKRPYDLLPTHDYYYLLLHSCITKRSLQDGKRLHNQLRSNDALLRDPVLRSKLITMYSVCGQINDARRVFYEYPNGSSGPDENSVWEAMLIAYCRNESHHEVLFLYNQMQYRHSPSNFALSSVLKSCCELLEIRFGKAVHAQVFKVTERNVPDQVVNNALLRLYADCAGCFDDASKLFDGMCDRNVVSWNSLLLGYVRWGRFVDCLEFFRKMQIENVGFSWVTLTTVLPVCGRLTALRNGKEIHCRIVRARFRPDIPVMNSLMDMYAKCGEVEYSWDVFQQMGDRDLMSWNIMIMGYGINGMGGEALRLFDKMVEEQTFRPDGVTFIALLSSCSHNGLTEEGGRLFNRMERNFGVSPMIEHYACFIDLLARVGRIEEALNVAENMPMSPSGSIWGSLLNSCWLYGNIELGEVVAEHLFELEPNNAGNYVILSNLYAAAGRWEDVKKVREMMEKKGLKKEVGCSWIQVDKKIHTFVAGGSAGFHRSEEYKRAWMDLMKAMEAAGYVPDTGVVLHDVNDEMKAMWVCEHSERLAVVFGLIHTGSGMPIRVTKNLRVCLDCHSALKIISKVTKRVIILRDTNRFHHFEDGTCSCKDYW